MKDAWRKTLHCATPSVVLAVQDAQVGVSDDPSFEVSAVRELIHASTAQIGESPIRCAAPMLAAAFIRAAALYGASTESEAPTTHRTDSRWCSGAPVEADADRRPDTPLLETFNACDPRKTPAKRSTRWSWRALADSQGMVEVDLVGRDLPRHRVRGATTRAGHITMPPSRPLSLGDLMP